MRSIACLLILTTCLGACASLSPGRADAILDAAEAPARDHAEALVEDDLDVIRRTGLALLTVLRFWSAEEGAT